MPCLKEQNDVRTRLHWSTTGEFSISIFKKWYPVFSNNMMELGSRPWIFYSDCVEIKSWRDTPSPVEVTTQQFFFCTSTTIFFWIVRANNRWIEFHSDTNSTAIEGPNFYLCGEKEILTYSQICVHYKLNSCELKALAKWKFCNGKVKMASNFNYPVILKICEKRLN